MGFSQDTLRGSREPPNANAPYTCSSIVVSDHYCHHNEATVRTMLKKMLREFGLSCFLPPPPPETRTTQNEHDDDDDGNGNKRMNLEHNKAWLLAESGGCGGADLTGADPHSVHSSFRFSFCSQVELESLNMTSSSAATVLMVNLDNGLCESKAKELKWRRFESLERNISPMASTLVRFSYADIRSATRNFSQGNLFK